jgi:hypothetical protein
MTSVQTQNIGLNPLQISLLRLFNRPMKDDEILSLKRILVKHYSVLLNNELERVIEEKGYTQEDFDKMLNEDS